jgi:glycosyltransferase involved in cell wall biosynthesis
VAIYTHDRPDSLRRCLGSIADAGEFVWETLVSVDGVDPRTDNAVDDFRRKISQLRLIRGPHLGFAPHYNACIDAASGDYLLFLDDDARLDDAFLAHALPHLREDTLVTGSSGKDPVPSDRTASTSLAS